eukprot:GHVU01155550.1.p1 GENE.GHVU01155550.1~~GHVU01155550.1.p1  ORF type:complete len:103 (+),score=7.42 GHVU01155550.1:241-549(+)
MSLEAREDVTYMNAFMYVTSSRASSDMRPCAVAWMPRIQGLSFESLAKAGLASLERGLALRVARPTRTESLSPLMVNQLRVDDSNNSSRIIRLEIRVSNYRR